MTATALQSPPRGAGTPQRFSPSAIWRSDAPPAFIGRMRGSRSAARLAALAAFAALPLALPSSWWHRLAGLPSLTPRALAASRAAFVRGGDHRRLVFRDGGQDVDGQAVGLGEVDGHEVDAALHQLGDEGDVAGQPVELGDHQGGAVQAAQAERPVQLGPVVALAALDLGHLGGQRPAPAVEVGLDRFPLRLQPKTGAGPGWSVLTR